MIRIEIDFPAGGRWHATAWGSHVNEGVPEWPPCPWRLCRALIATWHWKHRQNEVVLRSLVDKLASSQPTFQLPQASAAHSRHYMPVVAGKNETKTKIFDTFVHVTSGQHLAIYWPVTLEATEQEMLGQLLERLNYMGRAESLVSANVEFHLDNAPPLDQRSTVPQDSDHSFDHDTHEPIRLLAPFTPTNYASWLAQQTSPSVGKNGKAKTKDLPASLYDAMLLDTADWKKAGHDLPPGARWVEYLRPRDSFHIVPAGARPQRSPSFLAPTVARFALVGKVPPGIARSLSLAERMRVALLSRAGDGAGPAFTGRDSTGNPLTDHSHTYYLPECDEQGYVTHMTLFAPCGFDENDSRALAGLRKVWANEGAGFDLRLVLLATGQPDDFDPVCRYFRRSRVWRSVTPFVPVHHPKSTRTGIPKVDPDSGLQIGSPEHSCLRLLQTVAPDKKVKRISRIGRNGSRISIGQREIPCLDFQLQRQRGGGHRSDQRGYALNIEFKELQSLPLGLGYGAHFGLGLFVPVDTGNSD